MGLFKTGFSTEHYYKNFNQVYKKCFGEYYMLHYPLYGSDQDDLFQCQKNLTDHCLEKLPPLKSKKVLEIGCGNGIQAIYIYKKYTSAHIIGIDLNEENIRIANSEKERLNIQNIEFLVADAQDLKPIENNSIDIVINIESAFHYPDKKKFAEEVFRVLKPEGKFVIADILTRRNSSDTNGFWKKRMNFYHWSLDRYKDVFSSLGFEIYDTEDITSDIRKGFHTCSSWFRNNKSTISQTSIRIWGRIMIALNAYLLKKTRRYYVFAGVKSAERLLK